jgi:dihydroflavonol-4-reductase
VAWEDAKVNIFITGATGFVGSHLIRRLSKTNHRIICLVRETSKTDHLQGRNVTLKLGDVREKKSVLDGILGCQWVVHLAGVYSFWEPESRIYYEVNVEGTRNVMECALEVDVSKVIHLSTYGAFGIQKDWPYTEENSPNPNQTCKYTESKYLSDLIVWDLYNSKGLPVTVLHPANILGPGDDKATSEYIKNIIDKKFPFRVLEDHYLSCVHVGDVIEAIIKSLNKKDSIGEKYLIADRYITFKEFNEMIGDIAGVSLPKISLPENIVIWLSTILTIFSDLVKVPPLYGLSKDQVSAMISDSRCSGEKAERELGIKYTSIQNSLQDAIKIYQNN